MRFKKGSRQLRLILLHKKSEKQFQKLPVTFSTFFRLTNIELPALDLLKKMAATWQLPALPNRIKDFYYKFLYNKLPINTRLSHMLQNTPVDRSCTFCTITKTLPAPEETFAHTFWHCPTTQNIYINVTQHFIPELEQYNEDDAKKFFLTGNNNNSFPLIVEILRLTTLYQIWEMHQKKKVWQWGTFRINLSYEIKKITDTTSRNKLGLNTGFHLAVHWNNLFPNTW